MIQMLNTSKRNTPSFYIRDLPVFGDLILSPMDGYSDLPFRTLCRELGSAISYTEFVNVFDIQEWNAEMKRKLAFDPAERPVLFQIFDSEPRRLLEAALALQDLGPDGIDINMGCSDKHVSGRGAGAGLLRTPLKIARTFHLLSQALEIPVTGKIRLGWDDTCRNYLLVARIIEENGGSLVAVHGRTKQQAYGGQAALEPIAEICQVVNIPVIGNGDVRTPEDIEYMKVFTGCAGVMIGRGAIGNPWIFSRRRRENVLPEEVREVLSRHLERSLSFYGPQRGLVLFRKHASRYISPYRLPAELRQQLLTCTSPGEFMALVDRFLFVQPQFG